LFARVGENDRYIVVAQGERVIFLVLKSLKVFARDPVQAILTAYPDEAVQILTYRACPAARKPMFHCVQSWILSRKRAAKAQTNKKKPGMESSVSGHHQMGLQSYVKVSFFTRQGNVSILKECDSKVKTRGGEMI
jgi:hypothetical protein